MGGATARDGGGVMGQEYAIGVMLWIKVMGQEYLKFVSVRW